MVGLKEGQLAMWQMLREGRRLQPVWERQWS